eukprot:gene11211-biopygen13258
MCQFFGSQGTTSEHPLIPQEKGSAYRPGRVEGIGLQVVRQLALEAEADRRERDVIDELRVAGVADREDQHVRLEGLDTPRRLDRARSLRRDAGDLTSHHLHRPERDGGVEPIALARAVELVVVTPGEVWLKHLKSVVQCVRK